MVTVGLASGGGESSLRTAVQDREARADIVEVDSPSLSCKSYIFTWWARRSPRVVEQLKDMKSIVYRIGKNFGYRSGMQRRLLACSMMVLAVFTSDQVLAQEQEEGGGQAVFRAGVDLVTVSATVRDRRGRLVAGLEARDFEVVDGGQRRAISQFRTDRAPLSLAILFDVSGSMDVAARMTAAKFAAHHLLSWLEPGRDEA